MKKQFLAGAALSLLMVCVLTAFRFQRQAPMASVLADKMNVFYIGVDNPVSVAAAGVSPANLNVSLTNGTIVGSNGRYIVRVSGGTESTVSVSERISGSSTSLGVFKYRVKRVPDPVAYFGGSKGTAVLTTVDANAVAGVFARMENFDFDLLFSIVSYDLTTISGGKVDTKSANGPALTADMKQMLNGLSAGDRFLIENVAVKGPDGAVRKIPGVSVLLK